MLENSNAKKPKVVCNMEDTTNTAFSRLCEYLHGLLSVQSNRKLGTFKENGKEYLSYGKMPLQSAYHDFELEDSQVQSDLAVLSQIVALMETCVKKNLPLTTTVLKKFPQLTHFISFAVSTDIFLKNAKFLVIKEICQILIYLFTSGGTTSRQWALKCIQKAFHCVSGCSKGDISLMDEFGITNDALEDEMTLMGLEGMRSALTTDQSGFQPSLSTLMDICVVLNGIETKTSKMVEKSLLEVLLKRSAHLNGSDIEALLHRLFKSDSLQSGQKEWILLSCQFSSVSAVRDHIRSFMKNNDSLYISNCDIQAWMLTITSDQFSSCLSRVQGIFIVLIEELKECDSLTARRFSQVLRCVLKGSSHKGLLRLMDPPVMRFLTETGGMDWNAVRTAFHTFDERKVQWLRDIVLRTRLAFLDIAEKTLTQSGNWGIVFCKLFPEIGEISLIVLKESVQLGNIEWCSQDPLLIYYIVLLGSHLSFKENTKLIVLLYSMGNINNLNILYSLLDHLEYLTNRNLDKSRIDKTLQSISTIWTKLESDGCLEGRGLEEELSAIGVSLLTQSLRQSQ